MTDQERQLLEELADRIRKAPPSQVDRDADDLIKRSIGSRPDALYLLTQTVLIQEMALNQAKQQLDDLKRQQPSASFLGNAAPPAGTGYGRTSGSESRPQQPSGYRASTYQSGYVPPAAPPAATTPPPLPQNTAPQYGAPQYGAPQYAPPQSGFSSFLHNAAQTAAGIVAGEVAFSAISSLFGHGGGGYYGGGGFGGSGFLGGGGGSVISPVSETIINNTYNDTYNDTNNYRDENRGSEHGDRSSAPDRLAADDSDNDAGDYTTDNSGDDSLVDSTDDTTDDVTDDSDDSSSYDDGGSDSSDV